MRILRSTITILSLGASSNIGAMPLDGFLNVPFGANSRKTVTLETGYDLTTDTVDYSPNTGAGTHSPPVSKKRFEGAHIGGRIHITNDLLFDGFLWQRKIISLRDSYSLHSIQGAVQYTLPNTWHNTHFAIRAGAWSNYSDVLDKNSYTRYRGYLFSSASIYDPRDQQLQLNLIATKPLTSGLTGSFFTGIGKSKVGFSRLEGEIRSKEGCRYRFSYEKGTGELEQLGRCGSVTRMKMKLPTDESIKNNIGIEPGKELSYQSIYWQLGGNISWRSHDWHTRFGYFFQRYNRSDLDQRIEDLGADSSKDNHTLLADLEYRVSGNLGLFFRSEYMSNRLINMVPFTYNGYTAGKFGKSGLLFFSGVTLAL